MDELDDDEREYLAAFATVHTPAADEIQASLARVRERIAAGDAPSVGSLEEEPSRSRSWVVWGVATVALAAAVVLLFTLDLATQLVGESTAPVPSGAAYADRDGDEAGGQAVPREPSQAPLRSASQGSANEEAVPEVEEPEAVVEVEEAEVPVVIEEPVERRRPRPAERPREPIPAEPTPSEPVADATLHAEIALLRPAQKALRTGDHARALQLLEDHAKSFPRSVLAEERSLGRIQALCGLGRTSDAQRSIDTFVRTHPGSPLTGRVKKACPASEAP